MSIVHDEDGIQIHNGEALTLLREMSIEFDAVITDPPYSSGGMTRGDRVGQSTRDKYQLTGTEVRYPVFAGDNRDQRGWGYWCTMWLTECLRLTKPGAPLVCFSDWRQLPTLTDAIQAAGWVWRGLAVWDKTEGSRPANGRYRNQCEYLVWGSAGPMPDEGPCLPGMFRHPVIGDEKFHTTGKPVKVMREVCKIAWRPGSVILDPFTGSGSTLIAARDNGQSAIGIEISLEYCHVAKQRLGQRALQFTD